MSEIKSIKWKEAESNELLKRRNADFLQDLILDEKNLHEVLSFHQKSTWFKREDIAYDLSRELKWAHQVEYSDILPENASYIVELPVEKISRVSARSHRSFDRDAILTLEELGNLLNKAFGRDTKCLSKEYPSAGGLYPIIPLLYILDESKINGIVKEGCYGFDSTQVSLHLIKEFSNDSKTAFLSQVQMDGKPLSNLLIGYSLDIKRAITKYKIRGYRHGLIEAGLMAQNFRHSLEEGYGDVCWSGFNDNPVTKLSGLNVRLCPVILLQWFGKKV